MKFLAVDVGTSFFKGAVVCAASYSIRNVIRRPSPEPLAKPDPLHHEHDANAIVEVVRAILEELSEHAPECEGILLTGQMGGLVLSTSDAQPLTPYISWLDRRATGPHSSGSGSMFQHLSDRTGDNAGTVFGNEFRPGLPLSFLWTLHDQGQLTPLAGSIPVTLPDFVAAALCGGEPVMEWTGATGTLDIRKSQFPVSLLDELGLPALEWPQLVDFRYVVGHCRLTNLTLPVYAATGDHQCALAGTLLSRGELSINISTGSQVSMLTDDTTPGDFQIRPFFDGQYLKTITNIPAGRALTAIIRLLTEMPGYDSGSLDAWKYFFNAAARTPKTDVQCNLGFFPGAVEGPGEFTNLQEDTLTVGHVARASVEQMADYYQQLSTRLDAGRSWHQLAFSGGIAQQAALLRDLIVERLQAPWRLAATTEDSMFGMIILGRVIAGLNETVADATADAEQYLMQEGTES